MSRLSLLPAAVIGLLLLSAWLPSTADGANVVVQDGRFTVATNQGGFGQAVAIDGNVAVFGDPNGMAIAPNQYIAAYVEVHGSNGWGDLEQLTITYPAGLNLVSAGWAVAVSGDTIVIGAPHEDILDPVAPWDPQLKKASAGAVYIFVNNGTSWVQQARLTAPTPAEHQQFGQAVAIDDDELVVGAADGQDNGTGSAYVFQRSGSTWSASPGVLTASNPDAGDQFGYAVSISGNTIAVGAWSEQSAFVGSQSDNSATWAGAAYVFTGSGTTWSQQAYIKPSNARAKMMFGRSLSVSGDTLAVGAGMESSAATGIGGNQNDTSAPAAGAAYVFKRSSGSWSQQAYIKASNTDAGDGFGSFVSIDGNRLLVGAPGEQSSATGINGNQTDNSVTGAGAAYLFTLSSGKWSQKAYIKPSHSCDQCGFGVAALSGAAMIVGAPNEYRPEDYPPAYRDGVAYTFREVADSVAPNTSKVGIGIQSGAQVNGVPAEISWSATDNTSSSQQLRHDVDVRHHTSAGWSSWTKVVRNYPTMDLTRSLVSGTQYEVRVRTHDEAGNVGLWVVSSPFTAKIKQETAFVLTGSWKSSSDPQAMGTHVIHSSSVGARARLTFSGTGVAAVMPTGSPSGRTANVCVDKGTASESCRIVDLSASAALSRRAVVVFSGLQVGKHTLDVIVKTGNVILDGAIVLS